MILILAKKYLKLIEIISIPLLASILPIIYQNKVNMKKKNAELILNLNTKIKFRFKQSYCAFIMIIMSFYWLTECIPIGITSLLPMLLFPLFGIMSSKHTAQVYFQVCFYNSLIIHLFQVINYIFILEGYINVVLWRF